MIETPREVGGIEIVPFAAEHGDAFYALNRAWLDAHDLYEPPDEAQLADPQNEIIGPAAQSSSHCATERSSARRPWRRTAPTK